MEISCCNKSHGLLVMVLLCSCVGISVQHRPFPSTPSPTKRHFHFNVEWKNMTLLCSTKPLLTVNGKYPGPTIAVYEGDEVEVRVTNHAEHNTTIHWHGIRQYRTGWADGPAYITQCPIQSKRSYTYKFKVDQRGTFWWHAHISWQRASVHGPFIVYPRTPFPFPTPIQADIPIILGEWWKGDVEAVLAESTISGGGANVSDAYTINGLPGPLYPCSAKDTFVQTVEHGKTYMLRIINAILNEELFFAVANHSLIVVEIDGSYVKPFATPVIMITPGQTTNVILTANQTTYTKSFSMAASPYVSGLFPFDNTTTVGFIHYKGTKKTTEIQQPSPDHPTNPRGISLPKLPPLRDTTFSTDFSNKLRSLASPSFPCNVPKKVDKQVFLTISLNLQNCPPNRTCKGLFGKWFSASINNQSFIHPTISILESHYLNLATHPFSLDFPEKPPHPFNYTAISSTYVNMNSEFGNKLLSVPYGTCLEFVLQGTSFLNLENHPIHFHGHNVFIVGSGFGNFDSKRDPASFNLLDPPERNTVAIPRGGWAVIRFKADNPGVWFVHCHIEAHITWGLAMAFIVENGPDPSQSLPPPPKDLPQC